MVKGETVSEYFISMKLAFNEADMGKASIGTVMLSLLIANLPSDGAEGKIKQELLKLLQKTPNPREDDFHIFTNKIKEIASFDLAFKHQRNQGRNSVRVVKENMEREGAARDIPWVHQVCGKSHKRGAALMYAMTVSR